MRFVPLTRTAIRAVGGIAGLRPTFSRITALRPITARFLSSTATVVHGKYEVRPSTARSVGCDGSRNPIG